MAEQVVLPLAYPEKQWSGNCLEWTKSLRAMNAWQEQLAHLAVSITAGMLLATGGMMMSIGQQQVKITTQVENIAEKLDQLTENIKGLETRVRSLEIGR